MALPVVMAALLAGGSLVPHAAGGLIVSSAGGYVAGTYLSTSAISSILLTLGATTTGFGAIAVPRIASIARTLKFASIGGATVATGVETAAVTAASSAAATTTTAAATTTATATAASSIVLPLIGIGVAALVVYLYRLYKKVNDFSKKSLPGSTEELIFTDTEARVIEAVIRYWPLKNI